MAAPRSLQNRFPVPSKLLLRALSRPFSTSPTLPRGPPPKTLSTKDKLAREKERQKRKKNPWYKLHDLKEIEQFSLCDAMRYIRAFEVGRSGLSTKYEAHVHLRTKRDGPVIKSQIRLPHSVKTDLRIAVICPPGSSAATAARAAGAVLVGEEEVFDVVKSGKYNFDRVLAHPDSVPKMGKAGLGKILGPRGLMPSAKLGTVVTSLGNAVRTMLGASMYRERVAVVNMAIGQLKFTPEQLRDNLSAFVGKIRKDAAELIQDGVPVTKEIAEVVLSSTNAPGFSLNGNFKSADTPPLEELRGL